MKRGNERLNNNENERPVQNKHVSKTPCPPPARLPHHDQNPNEVSAADQSETFTNQSGDFKNIHPITILFFDASLFVCMPLSDALRAEVMSYTCAEWLPYSYEMNMQGREGSMVADTYMAQPWRHHCDVLGKVVEFVAQLSADEREFKCLRGESRARLMEVKHYCERLGLDSNMCLAYNSAVVSAADAEEQGVTLHFRDLGGLRDIHPPITAMDRAAALARGDLELMHVTFSRYRRFWQEDYAFSIGITPIVACSPCDPLVFLIDACDRWAPLRATLRHLSTLNFVLQFLFRRVHNWNGFQPFDYVEDLELRWCSWASEEVRAACGRPSREVERKAVCNVVEQLVFQTGWTCCLCNGRHACNTAPLYYWACVCSKFKCACWWDVVYAVLRAPENQDLFRNAGAVWELMQQEQREKAAAQQAADILLMNSIVEPVAKRARVEGDVEDVDLCEGETND